MIVYHDILGKLKDAGYSQHRLRKEKLISSGTLMRIHDGKSISTETIGKVCELCGCQPADLITWEQDG